MQVVIAGGHGQIALHLERMLAARGDRRQQGRGRRAVHSSRRPLAGAAHAYDSYKVALAMFAESDAT
jgi:hypothetical protein